MNKAKTLLGLVGLLSLSSAAWARIETVTGPSFDLIADAGYINSPDGTPVLIWGYGNINGSSLAQYPGPTMEVNQGDAVTVSLSNNLNYPVSLVFPGQTGVSCTGGTAVTGAIAKCEAAPGDAVIYTFTAGQPGTYMYYSGTRPDIQVEMGLVGSMVVRPTGYAPGTSASHPNRRAYGHVDSQYDHEHLFVLTEMDLRVHEAIEFGGYDTVDTSDYHASLWFINGRNGPDTLNPDDPAGTDFPYQPYGSLVLTRPNDKVLLRVVGAGKELHPLHTHGNHFTQIARDGRLLSTGAAAGADLAFQNFTLQSMPGGTYDALWSWTGAGLGWDMYGYNAVDNPTFCGANNQPLPGYPATTQDVSDRCKPVPVTLPENQAQAAGPFYSGGPFLGTAGNLPPGQGGLNPWGGYFYMWHSHTERELVNNDLFPGGMLTMAVVVPPNTTIGD